MASGRTPTSTLNSSGEPFSGRSLEVELGVADRRDAGVLDRLLVPAGERAAHGLVEHGLAPDALDHDLRRDLALAEAGDLQLLADLAGGALHLALERGALDLDLQAHARVAELLGGGLHGGGHASATDDSGGGEARGSGRTKLMR